MNKFIRRNIISFLCLLSIGLIMWALIISVLGPGYEKITIDGHEYLKFAGYYSSSVIHSENCFCKKEK